MGRAHDVLGLIPVSDQEWLNEVPDEMLDVYIHPSTYTKEDMIELKKQFPKWFKKSKWYGRRR